jgi:hypothetical protein
VLALAGFFILNRQTAASKLPTFKQSNPIYDDTPLLGSDGYSGNKRDGSSVIEDTSRVWLKHCSI